MSKPTFDQKWLEDYDRKRAIAQARPRAGAGLPAAQPERPVRHEPLAKDQGKKESTSRRVVCFVSLRTRLLDRDNICPKYAIDQLRYSGVLVDDTIRDVDIRVYQHKVRTVKEEKTLVLIYDDPVPW